MELIIEWAWTEARVPLAVQPTDTMQDVLRAAVREVGAKTDANFSACLGPDGRVPLPPYPAVLQRVSRQCPHCHQMSDSVPSGMFTLDELHLTFNGDPVSSDVTVQDFGLLDGVVLVLDWALSRAIMRERERNAERMRVDPPRSWDFPIL